jgi:hypothetical protein
LKLVDRLPVQDSIDAFTTMAREYMFMQVDEKAESYYKKALTASEQSQGQENLDLIAILSDLAQLYTMQWRNEEAESCCQRSLAIAEKNFGANHFDICPSLSNLAVFYETQSLWEKAEPLYQRILDITERQLGVNHPDVAHALSSLAHIYMSQELWSAAEILYQRILSIKEKSQGRNHPEFANALYILADIYKRQGKTEAIDALRQIDPARVAAIARTKYSKAASLLKFQELQALVERIEIIEDDAMTIDPNYLVSLEEGLGCKLPEDYKYFYSHFGPGRASSFMDFWSLDVENNKLWISEMISRFNRDANCFQGLEEDPDKPSNHGNTEYINLLENSFIFAAFNSDRAVFWDLRTYDPEDDSYDIYWDDIYSSDFGMDEPEFYRPIYLGRSFSEFLCDFCYGQSVCQLIPGFCDDDEPMEVEYMFFRWRDAQLS